MKAYPACCVGVVAIVLVSIAGGAYAAGTSPGNDSTEPPPPPPPLIIPIKDQPRAAVSASAAPSTPPSPQPAGANGLELTIQPTQAVFQDSELLGFKLSFRNTTGASFRLPIVRLPIVTGHKISNQVQLLPLGYLQLLLKDVKTGKVFTGGSYLPGGILPDPNEIETQTLAPGGAWTLTKIFQGYGYLDGDLDPIDLDAANSRMRWIVPQAQWAHPPYARPPTGEYDVSVRIFLLYTTLPSRINADPTPLWHGTIPTQLFGHDTYYKISSKPVRITIVPGATPAAGAGSGSVARQAPPHVP